MRTVKGYLANKRSILALLAVLALMALLATQAVVGAGRGGRAVH